MLKAKDLRHRAWNALGGKWGTMALCTLIYELIIGACAGLSVIYVGGIALLLIDGPLTLGFVMLAVNVTRGCNVKVETLFDGFKNFGKAFLLALINSIFVFLWSLLFIIPGIIKALSYSMSTYILADNPGIEPNEARKQSMAMMNGHKWRLFCLEFSFIGWLLLCGLTFGILTFWVTPYVQTAIAEFYQDLLVRNGMAAQPVETIPEVPAEPFEQQTVAEEAPAEQTVEENNNDAE